MTAVSALGDLGCDLFKDTLSEISPIYELIHAADDIAEAGMGEGLIDC